MRERSPIAARPHIPWSISYANRRDRVKQGGRRKVLSARSAARRLAWARYSGEHGSARRKGGDEHGIQRKARHAAGVAGGGAPVRLLHAALWLVPRGGLQFERPLRDPGHGCYSVVAALVSRPT